MNRRAALGTMAASAMSISAIEPIARPVSGSRLKLGLAAYSLRKYLDLKSQPKPAMNLFGFADFAAKHGCDAIEPTSYYFADTSIASVLALKGHCARLGLEISGSAVGNNFCHEDPTKRNDQVKMVKDWLDRVSLMGGRTLRVFAGQVAKGTTEQQCRQWATECIREACDHAGKVGVYVALENHGGITGTAEQMMALVKAVDHPWFGVNLDSGNFKTNDPFDDLAKLAPYAVVTQFKSEIQPANKPKQRVDYNQLAGIIRKANYSGYVILEYEASEEPLTAIPRELADLAKVIKAT